MFGQKKTQSTTKIDTHNREEVAHTFDQTNGVMKAFDAYQAKRWTGERPGDGVDRNNKHHTSSNANGDVPTATNMLFGGQ